MEVGAQWGAVLMNAAVSGQEGREGMSPLSECSGARPRVRAGRRANVAVGVLGEQAGASCCTARGCLAQRLPDAWDNVLHNPEPQCPVL